MTETAERRWDEVLATIVRLLPAAATVLIDGPRDQAVLVAGRLAAALPAGSGVTVAVSGGASEGAAPPPPDVLVWLREADIIGREADIIVDLTDRSRPVIRQVNPALAGETSWDIAEIRAFFAAKASSWDVKLGADLPAYAAAVARTGIRAGDVVADVGCGTGRALPPLRAAVGPRGVVLGIDLTPEMLAEARRHGRSAGTVLTIADVRLLPLGDAALDAVFAAGLIGRDVHRQLTELARVTRSGGRLAMFHPSGRAALAARRGRVLDGNEALAADPLRAALSLTGWSLASYDDAPGHFFALARRD